MAAAQWLTWVAFAWAIYFDVYQDEPIQQLSQQLKALQADMSEIQALLVEHLDSPQRGA